VQELPHARAVEVVLLLASPLHRYDGRPADRAAPYAGREVHDRIKLRAGLGVVGDRFFNTPAHRMASVTVMGIESVERLDAELGLGPDAMLDPAATRRNILLRGVDVDALRGAEFSLDTGDGPVRFRAHRPANPCAWMDTELAPGAFRALRGRGGVRCEPLTDGALVVGRAELRASVPLLAA